MLPPNETDMLEWTGKDFEFLIVGDIHIPDEHYDKIMTPNSFEWTKNRRDGWPYYQVGGDEFTYSWEMPGIQMTFNDSISFAKAKIIVDEVVANLKAVGQHVELQIIDSTKLYQF